MRHGTGRERPHGAPPRRGRHTPTVASLNTSAADRRGSVGIMVPSRGVGCRPGKREGGRADDLHDLPVAASAERAAGGIAISHGFAVRECVGRGRAEQMLRADDRGAALAVGEQAEVTDTHEAAWEHVHQEAPEKFLDVERHDLRASAIGVILPAKLDDAGDETDQPCVRDRDPCV